MANTLAKALPVSTDLMKHAIRVANSAYAPYSHFFVGAAVRCENGEIYRGCNVENVAYPLGICAEAAAIAAARAAEGNSLKIAEIAVYAKKETAPGKFEQQPCTPCGGCRQRIAEFGADIQVLFFSSGLEKKKISIADLLPFAFSFDSRDFHDDLHEVISTPRTRPDRAAIRQTVANLPHIPPRNSKSRTPRETLDSAGTSRGIRAAK